MEDNRGKVSSVPFPFGKFPNSDISEFLGSSEKFWSGPFTFALAADPQFGLIESHIQRKAEPKWDAEIELTTRAVKILNKMTPKPKFLAICGDMLDTPPTSPEKIEKRGEQYVDFIKVFEKLDSEIKLIFVCGNHDVDDIPTEATLKIYRDQFGPDFFSFWVGGVKFSVLNSQFFKSPESVEAETTHQDLFMLKLMDPTAVHQVILQHLPYFVRNINEEEVSYQNLSKDVRIRNLKLFDSYGVSHVLCGHLHRNAGGTYRGIEQIVTGALGGPFGPDPSGFRIFHVTKDKIEHEYHPVAT